MAKVELKFGELGGSTSLIGLDEVSTLHYGINTFSNAIPVFNIGAQAKRCWMMYSANIIINFEPTTGELITGNYSYFKDNSSTTWTKNTSFYFNNNSTTVQLNSKLSSGSMPVALLCTTE